MTLNNTAAAPTFPLTRCPHCGLRHQAGLVAQDNNHTEIFELYGSGGPMPVAA